MRYKFTRSLSYVLLLIVTTAFFTALPYSIHAESTLELDSDSAILVDAETGKVLYAKNPDEALPPASMTKMMTEYLVWEAIEEGKIKWDQTTQISDYPYSISANPSFSGIGLRQSVDYTVQSLYEAMAINSDNGTTIALAELIAGSEGEFVKLMNEKAEEMGLPDYKFVNSTGLDNEHLGENYPEGTESDDINLLSARSSALLAYYLVNDFPEALEISSIPETEFDGQMIRNYNWMLPHETTFLKQYFYEGIDGLKTGNTDLAKYCFTGTAEVDGKRLITVVMKADDEDQRFKETAELFDYGYDNFQTKQLFPEGYQLDEESILPIVKGKDKTVEIATKDAIHLPIKQGDEEKYSIKYHIDEEKLNENGELTAPIDQGEKVGTAEVIFEGTDDGYITNESYQQTVDIVTINSVEKSNWFIIIIRTIGDFFSTIVDTIKGWF